MVIYYKVGSRYYQTYNGKVVGVSIFEPLGEETIKKVSYNEFDKLIEKGDVYF